MEQKTMAERKSFLVYFDNLKMFKRMTNETRGEFFLAMIEYASDKTEPEFSDPALWYAWDLVEANLDRDYRKWDAMCKRNKENGRLGGKPKRTQSNPVGSSGGQSNPHGADIEIDIETDRDIYSDIPEGKPVALWKKRPTKCDEETWQKYLDYSETFLKSRNEELGKIVTVNDSTIVEGAKALDNLIRVKGFKKQGVHETIQWAIGDSFWSTQVRSLGSLTRKSGNGDIKFMNIAAARQRELTGAM